jgi:hypothetical protein
MSVEPNGYGGDDSNNGQTDACGNLGGEWKEGIVYVLHECVTRSGMEWVCSVIRIDHSEKGPHVLCACLARLSCRT